MRAAAGDRSLPEPKSPACFPLLCGDGQSVQQLLDELVTAFHLLLEASEGVTGVCPIPAPPAQSYPKITPSELLKPGRVFPHPPYP